MRDEQDFANGSTAGALIVRTHDYPVDFALSAWLHAKHVRSQSRATRTKYETLMASYRDACRRAGFDLDGPTRELATIAQAWANAPRSRDGQDVAPATVNLRLAVISSFYVYARRMDYLHVDNPAERVARAAGDTKYAAHPLANETVATQLAKIGDATPADRRDRALLAVALATGRRLSEVAHLTIADVDAKLIDADRGRLTVTLHWRRMKGGKTMDDTLPSDVAAVLLAYLVHDRAGAKPDAPVWLSYAGPDATRGTGLGVRGVERVCAKRLGVSKFHATRHTFARAMEDAGAKVSEIQTRLGHSNIAITSRYLARNRRDVNPYAERIAAMLGLTAD